MRLTHKSTPIVSVDGSGFCPSQGFGGATSSKHGNPKFIPLTATGITVSK
jgi:hypothetical protein